jgi:hypothetical protein
MKELSYLKIPCVETFIEIDLTDLIIAEGRIQEVATTNQHKGAELLATFNIAYLNASRFISALEYASEKAEQKVRQIKAIILMDRMKDILAAKGLTNPRTPLGSEDIRTAVYETDPEYVTATEMAFNLKCYLTQFQDKRKAFQMAYDGTKKVMGTGDNNSFTRPNPHLITQLNGDSFHKASEDDFFGNAK